MAADTLGARLRARPRPTQVWYRTAVGPGVSADAAAEFGREVARVLADPRGWAKYGYLFALAAPEGRAPRAPDLTIRLEASDRADRLCGARGLSCWRESRGDVVIREGNWLGGSASHLPPERYHNYVVSHEVGHALGLEHQLCPYAECARRGMRRCPASVMQQMSRGPAHVWPCVESDWPLDPDWRVDDPRGKRGPPPLCLGVAALVVLALVLAFWACTLTLGALGARVAGNGIARTQKGPGRNYALL